MTETIDFDAVWTTVTDEVAEIASPQERAYLRLTRLYAIVQDTGLVSVPNTVARNVIESRMRQAVTDALSRRLGRSVQVAVTVRPQEDGASIPAEPPAVDTAIPAAREPETLFDDPSSPETSWMSTPSGSWRSVPSGSAVAEHPIPPIDPPPIERAQAPEQSSANYTRESLVPYGYDNSPAANPERPHAGAGTGRDDRRTPPPTNDGNRLNPKYMFETFVIGSSNRFAHAASVAVAESPAKAYNPLFIYGGSGLGKTHLLHAIGHYATSLGNARSVRYVSTEEFTNDFINSLRDDKTQAFQRRYRDVDILLIDDIQFLESRERTQEEFFHTFNTLHNANKQLVISSDRSPKQLSTLEDRLRTRFEWGLLADIQPPDLETRIAILQKKAAQERLFAPPDVLEFIASRISNSIRELEGALIRVTAFALADPGTGPAVDRRGGPARLHPGRIRTGDHRGPDHGGHRRLLRRQPGGPEGPLALAGPGQRPPGGYVSVSRADRSIAAPDRPGVRRPRPHDRHARGPQNPAADGRTAVALQPDRRAHEPHQATARKKSLSTICGHGMWIACVCTRFAVDVVWTT